MIPTYDAMLLSAPLPICQGAAAWEKLQPFRTSTTSNQTETRDRVQAILAQVREDGDEALKRLAKQFQDPILDGFTLSETQIEEAIATLLPETRQLLERAAQNIRQFGEASIQAVQPFQLQQAGFSAGMNWRSVERVACYVPGGRYPLASTALMTAITAQVAGVPDICIVSPDLQPATLYAGTLAGVRRFYCLGGAQAVAAMAYGTQSIPAVDMLVGPGNAYVTEAKRQLQGQIGIDMLAGPSEVVIIADSTANPRWVAIDLLAQAEHDPTARAYLLTDSIDLAMHVQEALLELLRQYSELPAYLCNTANWGSIFVLNSLHDCAAAVNLMAPEHVELLVQKPELLQPQLKHYGALFMGYNTPVPVGDYMAGPNHTLPTSRSARFSGALTPFTFLRAQSWIQAAPDAFDLLKDAQQFATLEGLTAHALAAKIRNEITPEGFMNKPLC